MKPVPSWLAALLLAACFCVTLKAASAPEPAPTEAAWQARYDQAMQQYAAKDYAAAAGSAQDALVLARAATGHTGPYVATSLNALALIRQAQGEPVEAVALLTRALAVSEQALGAHLNTGALALNLGLALVALDRPADALAPLARSLAIADGLAGDGGHAAVALRQKSLAALVQLNTHMGQEAQTQVYTQRLLSGEQAAATTPHADMLARQARTLETQGLVPDALALWREVLTLREAEQPLDRSAVARALTELTGLLNRAHRHDEAEPFHRRALALREAVDPNDPAIAGHLNELALWHLAHGDLVGARPLFARTLAFVEQHQGLESLEAARIVASQTRLHDARSDEAQVLNQRALSIYQRHPPTREVLLGQAQALNGLARGLYLKRRFKEAEPLFLKSLEVTEQALGPNDAGLRIPLENLQALYRSQGRTDTARLYGQRAEHLAIRP